MRTSVGRVTLVDTVFGVVMGVLVATMLAPLPSMHAAEDIKAITPTAEVDVLRVENLKLRRTLLRQQVVDLQRQVQEAGAKLEADQKALEEQLRASLKPPAEWTFDWERGAFTPPAPKTQ